MAWSDGLRTVIVAIQLVLPPSMPSSIATSKMSESSRRIQLKDGAILAELGYKQEFKRAFRPWKSFALAFSIIGLAPSIAYV